MEEVLPKQNRQIVEALNAAKKAARGHVVRSIDIDRKVRERLTRAGYLSKVMDGWYLLSKPAGAGTTTIWFSNYWDFIREYLKERFGEDYCLTPESSLDIHAGQNVISRQVTVITKKPSNQTVNLLHDTSLLTYQDVKGFPKTIVKKNGLNIIPLSEAICRATPTYFINFTLNMEICLRTVGSPADLSRVLLENNFVTASNRIVGALRALNETAAATQIQQDLSAAGYKLNVVNPFDSEKLYLANIKNKFISPYSGRIVAMWEKMRPTILEYFPVERGFKDQSQKTLQIIERLYTEDSYNSLSIEGYHVTPELIEKIQRGEWSSETKIADISEKDALAAKGYNEAFKSVVSSVKKVLHHENPGQVFYDDIQNWYRELFKPVVQAGILNPGDLAGYRKGQVYISGARHVPPPAEAILDSMEMLETLLKTESSAAVRAILGHFIFVYIHPYMDGNGRIGRFIMNLMLISGGYNWTVIRTSERSKYMSALEKASVDCDIRPFTEFVTHEMAYWADITSKMTLQQK